MDLERREAVGRGRAPGVRARPARGAGRLLEVWVNAKRAEAERWAATPDVVGAVRTLAAAARAGASREALASSPAQAQFVRLLAPTVSSDPERVATNAVDRTGRIIAARAAAQVGLTVGKSMQADLARVFAGESRFLSPRPESERVPGAGAEAFARPVAWLAAPVRDADGQVIAALKIGSYADTRFARILAPPAELADPESTGDVYAFDETGLLLTTSRYREALRAAGLLAPGARTAAFNVRLHDPGAAIAAGEPARADHTERPLTRLVAAAIASRAHGDASARRGELLEPYPNYVGREVIGAWQWLPEYELGLAIEVAAEEAYAPLRYLRIAVMTIFGLLVGAVGVALGSTFSLARLDREVRRLGQYRIEGKIDEGGMSTVHRAVHALLKRPTAIKILKPALATDEVIARFEREVVLASRLEHPATVEIFDYGRTRDGTFYYAMEYIDGITLARLVEKDGAQPVPRVAYILRQVCESLREAHGKGLIHRDVKPQNIMLCERGRVRRREGARFRADQGRARHRHPRHHPVRAPARDAAVHVAGARAGSRRRRPARGHLRRGNGRLLPAHGAAPVRRAERARAPAHGARGRGAARVGRRAPAPPARARRPDRALPREGSGRAPAARRRADRPLRRDPARAAVDAGTGGALVAGLQRGAGAGGGVARRPGQDRRAPRPAPGSRAGSRIDATRHPP